MYLELTKLSKKYGDKTVVDNLCIAVEKGVVHALLGSNGSGKTTTLRMILGLTEKTDGEILLNGKPFEPRKANVGYLPEERGLYAKYPVLDQLLYFASLKGMSKRRAKEELHKLSERLETDFLSFSKSKPSELSKGNAQKIQLISALLSSPDILILDEPFSGLDPVNTQLFKKIIKEEKEKGKIIIMSSHQMTITEELASEVTILSNGKTALQGRLDQVKKRFGSKELLIEAIANTHECLSELLQSIIPPASYSIARKGENTFLIKIENEEAGSIILKELIERNVEIISFNRLVPSLQELFIEKTVERNEKF